MSIRVVIADDQPLMRGGFRMFLDREPDIDVVGEAGDGLEALDVARAARPDVVLMDVRMPRMDGIEATRRLLAGGADEVRVIMLTTFDLDDHVYGALEAGASGFLLKDCSIEQLVEAVRVVAAGDALLAPSATRRVIEMVQRGRAVRDPAGAEVLEELTDREREVLLLVARGRSNAEIARELRVSAATVKTHVASILLKLGLRDRVQVVVFAYEHGVVRPGLVT